MGSGLRGAASSVLLVLLASFSVVGVEGALEEAKALAKSGDTAGAAQLLLEHLKRTEGDAAAHEWAGRWLLELERKDESAHQLATAIELYEAAGLAREASRLGTLLGKADRCASRRESYCASLCKDLLRAAEKLVESEQAERAEALLQRIAPLARDKDGERIRALLAEMAASRKQVDLDEAATDTAAESARPLLEYESEHYKIAANLERDVVELVGETMDDIYGSYVQIYFDGNSKKATLPKATIRIHASWDEMVSEYGGTASPGLGGWWSAGENRVVCYDTRDRAGSLDQMLDTLFHEASHQFMSMLSSGSNVPAWLNEGTSCFFEGAVAMADHRVLWPDAALERLLSLRAMLEATQGSPSLADVIGYESPGSYQGEYYPYGWGVVYFLQQWEDPATLTYAYRPLYARYRDEIIQKGSGSRRIFDEIFLGKNSPLGHESFADFERDWREWILKHIGPMHVGTPEAIRERRWQEAQRYLAAAALARETRKPVVSETELLLRALGHVEVLRQRQAALGDFTRELLLAQADIFQRLERGKAEAMTLEQLLDLVDKGECELEAERYSALEDRLSKLDSGNWALRSARSKLRTLEKRALELLNEYAKEGDALLLRSATFAGAAAVALASEGELAQRAASLRAQARERGLLLGRVVTLQAPPARYTSLFVAPPKTFAIEGQRVELASVSPAAMLAPEPLVRGEYELRARLMREAEPNLGAGYGWIVGGTLDAGAVAVGLVAEGELALWEVRRRAGAARPKRLQTFQLDPPLAADEHPLLVVRVSASGQLEIRVGQRPPIACQLPLELPPERQIGFFARDGKLHFEDALVELFP